MKHSRLMLLWLVGAWAFASCASIKPGEVGMKQTFGKLYEQVYPSGLVSFNPFVTRIVRVPTRTVNLEVQLDLPSKDGLNVQAAISILYRINADKAPEVVQEIGPDYEDVVILSVFRSAAADVCSQFFAKDMYTASRSQIEDAIQSKMAEILEQRGFVIEQVLMKSIRLPQGLARAIEEKLEAEQVAQRMEFELQREEREAERRLIEAKGIRDAQRIIEEGLSPRIIEWQSIEAFKSLANSPGTRLIITDGRTPLLIQSDSQQDEPRQTRTSRVEASPSFNRNP